MGVSENAPKFIDNIKRFCSINPTYSDLNTKFDSVLISLKRRLGIIPMYFRHFSRHDESHSEAIIQYLEMLFGAEAIEKISVSDQMFFVLSAYAHDIGMSLEQKQIEDFFNHDDFATELRKKIPSGYNDLDSIVKEILNFPESVKDCKQSDILKLYSDVSVAIENVFRAGHAKRSEKLIVADSSINALLNIRGAKLLSRICALHDGSIKNVMSLPFEENGFFGDYLHPRFVASMLCLGDLMDLDTDRFDEAILRASSKMPILSKLHQEKHESITHYLVKNGKIEICADCDNHKVYRVLNEWIGWLRSACTFLIVHWDEITPDEGILAPRLKRCDITIKGNTKWLGYADSKIHIDTEKAVKIFEGTNLYRGKHTFVRELIQNAVDATLIQLYDDVKSLMKQEELDTTSISTEDILRCLRRDEQPTTPMPNQQTNQIKTDDTATVNTNKVVKNVRRKLDIHDYDILGRFYEIKKDDCKASDAKLLFDDNETSNDSNDSVVVFELEDHGTGIAETEIESIICMRGKSEAIKRKIENIPKFFRPSGAFGIGIQSVFQVAKKIVYITKTTDEKAKTITINDPSNKGDVYVEDYAGNMHRGTKVLVQIDLDKFTQADLNYSSDYIYETTRKQDLILSWLFSCIYNISGANETRRETTDYFNIRILGFSGNVWGNISGDATKERDVLRRESILVDMAQNYNNENAIELDESEILKYRYYDLEKNCIFEAVFSIKSKPFINSDKTTNTQKDTVEFGRCSDWTINKYMNRVFYRNVSVYSVYPDIKDSFDKAYPAGRIIDYKINIFSDRADVVLNIGRNYINDDYYRILSELINYEISLMFKKTIDFCLKKDIKNKRFIFIAYVKSCTYGYKSEELYSRYKTAIDDMAVNNYFMDGKEISIPLSKIFNSKIYFLTKLSQDEIDNKIPKAVWSNELDCKSIENKKGLVCDYQVEKSNRDDEHILIHIITGEYYTIMDGKKYLVYETEPYIKNKKYNAAFRADFIRYKEFLHVVLSELRCVLATEGFEEIETPVVDDIPNVINQRSERRIEMMLASSIKNDLSKQLKNYSVIKSAKEVMNGIEASEVYKKNIDFIVNYHVRLKDNIERDKIEEKYKCFVLKLLSLLENKDYSIYLEIIKETRVLNVRDYKDEFNYFDIYRIERFSESLG